MIARIEHREDGTRVCLPCGMPLQHRGEREYRCPGCGLRVLASEGDARWLSAGPGTELKKLLRRMGFKSIRGCNCNAKARQMDQRGCEWCEQNLDEILGWLKEEAGKRGLPFLNVAARILVRRAIANARKSAGS